MALQTEGFKLSALPEKLTIPENVGKLEGIDPTKIYDSVVNGLKTSNSVMLNQGALSQAEAEQKSATAKANTEALESQQKGGILSATYPSALETAKTTGETGRVTAGMTLAGVQRQQSLRQAAFANNGQAVADYRHDLDQATQIQDPDQRAIALAHVRASHGWLGSVPGLEYIGTTIDDQIKNTDAARLEKQKGASREAVAKTIAGGRVESATITAGGRVQAAQEHANAIIKSATIHKQSPVVGLVEAAKDAYASDDKEGGDIYMEMVKKAGAGELNISGGGGVSKPHEGETINFNSLPVTSPVTSVAGGKPSTAAPAATGTPGLSPARHAVATFATPQEYLDAINNKTVKLENGQTVKVGDTEYTYTAPAQ